MVGGEVEDEAGETYGAVESVERRGDQGHVEGVTGCLGGVVADYINVSLWIRTNSGNTNL